MHCGCGLGDEVGVDVHHSVVVCLEDPTLHGSLLLQLKLALCELIEKDVVIVVELLERVPFYLEPLVQLVLVVGNDYLIFTDPSPERTAHF